MEKISIEQVLSLANSYAKKSENIKAQQLYEAILLAFPENKRALQGLIILNKSSSFKMPHKETIKKLIQLFNQGHLLTVIKQAEIFVKQYPEAFFIWNLLGVANNKIGKNFEASNYFKKATYLNSNFPDSYNNLGATLQDLGKSDEAIDAYKKALSLKPDYAEAYNNMGNALRDQLKSDEAIDAYKKALSLKPDYAEAYNNMGNALRDQLKSDEAIDAYKKALSLKPDYAEAYYNLGIAVQDEGRPDEAIDAYKKALSLKPDYAEAYNNMGNALRDQLKSDEAIDAYKKALSLKPDYAEAYYNLGIAVQDEGRPDEAIDAYKKALSLKPDYAEAYYNLGIAVQDEGRPDEAIDAYEKALSIKPNFVKAEAQKLHQFANICDWENLKLSQNIISELGICDDYIPPFSVLSFEDSPERHHLRSKLYAKLKYAQIPLEIINPPQRKPKRLRIGYFSSDFYNHATMYLMIKMFKIHNRKNFEIYVFSYGNNKEDEMKKRVMSYVDVFRDVSEFSDKEIALISKQNKIDIAVDLKGYTKEARSGIFAYRAAPVQINLLGYPGTMGAEFIDYIVADKILIPYKNRDFFSEKIIYMPHTYQVTDNERIISQKVFSRNEMNLPESAFVFCCFSESYKISHIEFDIWMRILHIVKKSVLWLIKSNALAEKNLNSEAVKRGINSNRLIFAEKLPQAEHLARYKLADLFLDTFNVNAHTTASDALWAGLPVITKIGKGFPARVAGSILNAIGLQELIVKNEKDYESLIINFATSPNKLIKIKQKLEVNRLSKPLFQTEQYTRNLEDGFQQAYKNYSNSKHETIDIT